MTFFSTIASLPFKVSILRSVGAKIFAIAAGLLAVMVAVAIIASQMAKVVSEELTLIERHYHPAYTALARANIRSVEEALALRRLIVHARAAETEAEEDRADVYRDAIFKAIDQTRFELQAARDHLFLLLSGESRFKDEYAISQLLARIDALVADYGRQNDLLTPVLQAVESREWSEVYAALQSIEDRRNDMNLWLDRYRTEMRLITEEATLDVRKFQEDLVLANMLVTMLACALGLIAAGFTTRSLVRPVKDLLVGAQRVEGGSLDVSVPVSTQDEIGQLTASFNGMVEELRKKERIRDTFGRYMDPRIVENLIERADFGDKGERRVMTVLFCDMEGYTTLSEKLTSDTLLTVVNRYLTLISEPVRKHSGVIDKYIGDAVMAYWGPPFVSADQQARLACEAALDMMAQINRFNAELPDLTGIRDIPPVNIRIGIATGEMLVGSIGSEFSQSYSVLGDSVVLASRLEQANKRYGTHIMTTAYTRSLLGNAFALREIDRIRVVGKTEAGGVYEIYGHAADVWPDRDAIFAEGLAAYRKGDWATARRHFQQAQETAGDLVAKAFLQRIAVLEKDPPVDWDGVWTMTHK